MKYKNVKKILFVSILFIFSNIHAQNMSVYLSKIDSQKIILLKTGDEKTKCGIYNSIAENYVKLGIIDSIKTYAEKALELGTRNNLKDETGWAHIWLTYYFKYCYHKKDIYENYKIALEIFRETNNKKGIIKALNIEGTYQYSFIKPECALPYFDEAVELLKTVKDPSLLLETQSNIAHCLHKQNQFNKADSLFREVKKATFVNSDTYRRFINNARQAFTLRMIKRENEAISLLKENVEFIRGIPNSIHVPDTYNDLAFILLTANQAQEALNYLESALKFPVIEKVPELIEFIYRNKVNAFLKLGNFKEAFEAKVKQAEQREKSIRLIESENMKMQTDNYELELQNNRTLADKKGKDTYIIIFITFVAVLLMAAIFLALLYRQNFKHNKELEDKIKLSTEELKQKNLQLNNEIIEHNTAQEELNTSKDRLQGLLDITQYKAKDIQDLLDYALNKAILLTKSKIGYIYQYKEDTKEFILNSWSNEVMKECRVINPQTIYQLEKTGIWGEAVRQRKAIIVNDFHSPNSLKKGYPEGHVALNRFFTIPVFNNDNIIAVVGMANKETDYDDSDVKHLTLFMDSVWNMVERKTIDEQLQEYLQLNEKLTNASSLGILAYNSDGDCVLANEAAAVSIGATIELLKTQNFKMLVSWKQSGLLEAAEKTLLTGATQKLTAGLTTTFGLDILVEATFTRFTLKNKFHLLITFQDITDRKHAEDAVRLSESKYRGLFENLTAGFALYQVIYDDNNSPVDYRYLEVNPAFEKMFSLKGADIVGKTAMELYSSIRQDTLDRFAQVDKTGKSLAYQYYSHTVNKYFDIWDFKTEEGHIVDLMTDITERKITEDALRESEIRFRKLFEDSAEAILLIENGVFVDCNKAAQDMLKYESIDKILNRPPDTISPEFQPDGRLSIEKEVEMISLAFEKGNNLFEWEHIKANGEHFIAEVMLTPIYYKDKNMLHVVWRDITDKKKTQELIRKNEEMLRQIIESSPIAMLVTTSDFVVQYINRTFHKLFGYNIGEIPTIAQWWPLAYPDETYRTSIMKKWDERVKEAERLHKPIVPMEATVICKNQTPKIVEFSTSAIGEQILVVFSDITERKLAEERINKMNDELKEMINTKDKFFSIIAHDIKSPMNALLGISKILKDDFDEMPVEDSKDLIKSVNEIGQETFQLLENLLNWSMLQRGKMEYYPSKINILDKITRTTKLLSEVAAHKLIKIVINATPDLEMTADDNMIELLIRNLISNAIKFSYHGGDIIVNAVKTGDNIVVSIKDNGTGMEKRFLDQLFKIDNHSSQLGTNKERGTGLGLFLCKDVVSLHKGQIIVESELGKGSKFTIIIPQVN